MLKTQINEADLVAQKDDLLLAAKHIWRKNPTNTVFDLQKSPHFLQLLGDLQKQTLAYPSHRLRQVFLEKLLEKVENEQPYCWWRSNECAKKIALTAIICVQQMFFK